MENKIFPWSSDELTDEEYEDVASIVLLSQLYGLGFTYSKKKFVVFNEHIQSESMSISDALVYMTSFENRFGNEIWFQPNTAKRNRDALARRLKGGENR